MHGLAGNRRRLLLLQNELGETLASLLSLLDQRMIQCLLLCVVEPAILVVLSAGARNMHSLWVGWRRGCTSKLLNAVHPVIYFVCDLAVSFRGFTDEAAEIA